ncbi:HD domain-containing protein [Pseudoalteromonas phenolica]
MNIDKLASLEQSCREFVQTLPIADAGHDLAHVQRVVTAAKLLAEKEQADLQVVVAAAWLHDCVAVAKNSPLRSQASKLAADKASEFLTSIDFASEKLSAVHHAIVAHSYSANVKAETLEAKIVQDADRLDSLGAIGIARCFTVGGAMHRSVYNVDDPFCEYREPDDYSYTVDHFYNKLF